MNENDKELIKGVLSQDRKVDFKALTQFIKPEIEPDEITRAMVESTRLRFKGLEKRLGIATPKSFTPDTSPKKSLPKKESSRGRKRKVHIEDDTGETSSPSKRKDKGQAKTVVKLEGSDKEDNAFEDAMFVYGHLDHDEA
ncbi:predicted protein [Sclerotinia sclerotiorum 1980 UF-70]|uniref:Uncharacterized protein n=2 Tax=Sclerotinia sclerotiorum (strain ATCC 18683 / 1980 / Ss-1) TaxID=665079 RepID=A7E627_SCLS1|nr:predicted protein [Sclerotinia sclerotiorum 1980 UF-70]APA07696.1 hypothetical protein sscle_03g024660 [Sclerotinia sclerotiorum 1980 UF-70]EDN91349.1 predicted protein [Sclerotinia sclerotiorum 1980 UF-70]